jgi:hypothetical protein
MPSFIGVPVAGFDGPNNELLVSPVPDDGLELLPHAARISPPQASIATAACFRAIETIIAPPDPPGRTPDDYPIFTLFTVQLLTEQCTITEQ